MGRIGQSFVDADTNGYVFDLSLPDEEMRTKLKAIWVVNGGPSSPQGQQIGSMLVTYEVYQVVSNPLPGSASASALWWTLK